MAKPVGIKDDVLNDLATRFLINIPDEDKDDPLKLCSHIEIAYWFYLDLIRPEDPTLPGCSMKEFMATIFQHCPFLVRDSVARDLDTLQTQWKSQKYSKPTRGAIILNHNLTKCLLVQGYPASTSWGFPKGKLERGESDMDCAIREVYEETGFDIRALIQGEQYLECQSQDSERASQMYIIPGIPEDTEFKPRVRKEIRDIAWFRVDDLPRHKKDLTTRQNLGKNPSSFFMIIPFISQLKKWIASHLKQHNRKSSRSLSATFPNPSVQRASSSPSTRPAGQLTAVSPKQNSPRASPQSVPKRAVTSPQSVPKRAVASPQSVPKRAVVSPQSVPKRTVASLQSIPKRVVAGPQSVPKRAVTSLQSVPKRVVGGPQSVPKRAVSGSAGMRTGPPHLMIGAPVTHHGVGTQYPGMGFGVQHQPSPVMRSQSIPHTAVPIQVQVGYPLSPPHPHPPPHHHPPQHHLPTLPQLTPHPAPPTLPHPPPPTFPLPVPRPTHPHHHTHAPIPRRVTLLPNPHPPPPHIPTPSQYVPRPTSVFNPVMPSPIHQPNFNSVVTTPNTIARQISSTTASPTTKFNPFAALGISTTAQSPGSKAPIHPQPVPTPYQWNGNGTVFRPVQLHLQPAQAMVRFQFDKARILSAI